MLRSEEEQSSKPFAKEAKDALVYVISNALIQIGNLIVIPLFWKKLNPEDWGVIALTDIVGTFLGIFLGLSLDQSINMFYYRWTEEQRKRGIGAIWLVSWSVSIVLGGISLIIFSFITEFLFDHITFYPFVFLGIIGIVFNSLSQITFTTIRIKRLPWFYSTYSLFLFGITLGTRIYYVLIMDQGLIGYYIANIMSSITIAIAAAVIMSRFATPCIRRSGLKASLKFSIPLIFSSVISAVTSLCDRLILQNYVSLSSLGIYSISLKFASTIVGLHNGIKLSYGPFIWQTINAEKSAAKMIAHASSFFIIPIFLSGFGMSLFINDIILLLDRPPYFPVAEYIPWTIGFTMVSCLYLYFSPGMMLGNRTDLLWIPSFFQLIAVCSGIFLVRWYEIYGIIAAKYFSAITFFCISFYYSQKVFPIPYRMKRLLAIVSAYVLFLALYSCLSFETHFILILEKIFLLFAFSGFVYLTTTYDTSLTLTDL
jgi:O-antigen/teichoic acid export membrane protein